MTLTFDTARRRFDFGSRWGSFYIENRITPQGITRWQRCPISDQICLLHVKKYRESANFSAWSGNTARWSDLYGESGMPRWTLARCTPGPISAKIITTHETRLHDSGNLITLFFFTLVQTNILTLVECNLTFEERWFGILILLNSLKSLNELFFSFGWWKK